MYKITTKPSETSTLSTCTQLSGKKRSHIEMIGAEILSSGDSDSEVDFDPDHISPECLQESEKKVE